MAEEEYEDYEKAAEAEARARLAAQDEGPVASPSVPFAKYILEDKNQQNIHPSLQSAVYDKEIAVTNLTDSEIDWLQWQFLRAEMMLKNSRPALAGGNAEEIIYSILPAKLRIKLTRSREGFERKQLTTMTTIRRVEMPGSAPVKRRSRWRIFGRSKE